MLGKISIFKPVPDNHLRALQALRAEFPQDSREELYRRYLNVCPAFVTPSTFVEYLMQSDLLRLETALANIRTSPDPLDERTEELKQHYEMVLCELESEFVAALLSGDWSGFDDYVSMFRHEKHNCEAPGVELNCEAPGVELNCEAPGAEQETEHET